jgi:hypothetical protein
MRTSPAFFLRQRDQCLSFFQQTEKDFFLRTEFEEVYLVITVTGAKTPK